MLSLYLSLSLSLSLAQIRDRCPGLPPQTIRQPHTPSTHTRHQRTHFMRPNTRALYSIKRAFYAIKRALYSMKRALYSMNRALYAMKRVLDSIKKALYSVTRAVCSIKRALQSVTRALYSVKRALDSTTKSPSFYQKRQSSSEANSVYGVATISRMLKNIGLFCKRALQKRPVFCQETCIFKHPTHRSHPIGLRRCNKRILIAIFIEYTKKSLHSIKRGYLQHLVQILRGGSSPSVFLIRELSN